MKSRSLSYGIWFPAALALHAGVFLAAGRLARTEAEYGVGAAPSVEVALIEAAPAAEPPAPAAWTEPLAEPAVVPEPEVPEPIPESVPPEPEPEISQPTPEPTPEPDAAVPFALPPPPAPSKPLSRRPAAAETTLRGGSRPAARPVGSGSGSATGGATGVVRAAPDYLRNPPPAYPAASRQTGEEGTVLLRVSVTEAGRPAAVSLARSSGHARLDQAAVQAVRRWRFRAAQLGGVPMASEVEVPVRFSLR